MRGDFWGGHFAAGAGLAGTLLFVAALLLQKNELELQRRDLRIQMDEAKRSRKALEAQVEMAETQVRLARRDAIRAERRDFGESVSWAVDRIAAARDLTQVARPELRRIVRRVYGFAQGNEEAKHFATGLMEALGTGCMLLNDTVFHEALDSVHDAYVYVGPEANAKKNEMLTWIEDAKSTVSKRWGGKQ